MNIIIFCTGLCLSFLYFMLRLKIKIKANINMTKVGVALAIGGVVFSFASIPPLVALARDGWPGWPVLSFVPVVTLTPLGAYIMDKHIYYCA